MSIGLTPLERQSLIDSGYTGAASDLIHQFLVAGGHPNLHAYYVSQGYTGGLNDMLRQAATAAGYASISQWRKEVGAFGAVFAPAFDLTESGTPTFIGTDDTTFSRFQTAIWVSKDGTRMMGVLGAAPSQPTMNLLSTANDITTETYENTYNTSITTGSASALTGFMVSDDGLFYLFSQNDDLYQMSLSTPFNLSTANSPQSVLAIPELAGANPRGVTFSPAMTYLTVTTTGTAAYHYSMTPENLGAGISLVSSTTFTFIPGSAVVSGNGEKLLVVDLTSDRLVQFGLSTPHDLSTKGAEEATLNLQTAMTASANPRGLFVANGYVYVGDVNSDDMFQYLL